MNASVAYDETADNLYVELKAGQYWKAKEEFESESEGYVKGDVLLLESVRDVDGQAHTVIMRPHPRWHADNPRTTMEIRFLVQDFLTKFEPCPDFARIRAAELALVQGRVSELQMQLAESNVNPEVMKDDVAEGMKKWEKEQKLLPGTVDSLPTTTPNTVLDGSLTTEKVEGMKLAMTARHKKAELQADWIKGKVEEIGETVQSMTPFYQEQAAAALASTEDIMTHVAKLMKGVKSLDLYVGTDVEVETIATGKDAPADTLLTIMQRKLYMDEELSVWAEVGKEFDFTQTKLFFKALKSRPTLVKQIFPTERCIVCMATLRNDREYENAYEHVSKNEINKNVFLLIRNGENIHAVWSPVESHLRSPRLFPSQADIDNIFMEKAWWSGDPAKPITFNDVKYTDKLSQAEAHSLHYKRFLILLAGLDHRLNLFGPFYEGPKDMKFISQSFQAKHMRFVHDDDGYGMLPREEKPDFKEWLQAKNAFLRSGSRVMAMWRDVMNSTTAPGAVKYNDRSRDGRDYMIAELKQKHGVDIAIRMGKEIFIKAPVKAHSWRSGQDREFNANVNLSKFDSGYRFGYICLDAVKADELEYYILDREARTQHLDYVRLFKAAVNYLRAEEKEEAGIRKELTEALSLGNVATGEKAEQIVDTTVMGWRAAHRGASLTEASEPNEYKKLLNQMWVVSRTESGEDWQKAEEWAKANNLEPLRFVMSGKSTLSLYCAPQEEDNRLWPHAWTINVVLLRRKDGFKEYLRRSRLMPELTAAETTLHEWAGAAKWAGRKAPLAKIEDKIAVFNRCMTYSAENDILMSNISGPKWDACFEAWKLTRASMALKSTGRVENPVVMIPIGLRYNAGKNTLKFIALGEMNAAILLYRNAPDEARRSTLMTEYVRRYANKQVNREELIGRATADKDVTLWEFPVDLNDLPPTGGIVEDCGRFLDNEVKLEKLNGHIMDVIKKGQKESAYTENEKKMVGNKYWVPNLYEKD